MKKEKKRKILKIAGYTAGGIVLLLVIVLIFLNGIVKYSVQTAAPLLLGTDVTIEKVDLRPFKGSFELGGIRVGNPKVDGVKFSSPEVLSVKTITLKLVPSSLFSDKIIIRHLLVRDVNVYYEPTAMIIFSNISILNDNVKKLSSSSSSGQDNSGEKKKETKLQVDDLDLENINTHLVLGGDAVLPIPDINFDNLGAGPDGITPGSLISDILNQITIGVLTKVGTSAGSAGSALLDFAKGLFSGSSSGKKSTPSSTENKNTPRPQERPASAAPATK